MSLISIPYTFVAGTTIASAQVNADFQAIVNVVNGGIDGSNLSTVFTTLTEATSAGTAAWAGGFMLNWGAPAPVAFDNSAPLTQTFKTPFPTACVGVWCQIPQNTQTQAQLVVAYPNSITLTNFVLNAMGGVLNRTGTVFWLAIGY